MLAQRLNTERRGRKSILKWFLALSTALLILGADILSAQNYEFTIKVRRLGDQVGAEIWAKSLSSGAPKLGDFTFSINYRSDFLDPAAPDDYTYYETDSVITDVNREQTDEIPDYPYQAIESPFHNDNGYSAIQVNTGSIYPDGSGYGYSEIEVNFSGDASTQGIQPGTDGLGSFVALIVFDITDHSSLSDTSTVGIGHNTRAYPAYSYNDVDGTTIELSDVTYNDPAETNIKGITILNPRGPNESVDRDAQYLSMPVAGYPVYFERSGLINSDSYSYGTPYVAYEMTYSLDGGSSWTDVMRFAETGDSIKTSDYDNYASGDLETRFGGVPGYIITKADGDPLTSGGDGYDGIVRVIWASDESFSNRSENAKVRLTQLSTSGVGSDIDNRSTTSTYGQSESVFGISRLFFVQFNGTDEYLRTKDSYSNATQLTVEAWVNLNEAGVAESGVEPAIVASSGGPSSPEEGAWMLYLQDGMYPAFRARTEGYPTETDAPFYIGTLESSEALTDADADITLSNDTQSETHRGNWAHLAATVKNDSITLYVNGQIVSQTSNQTTNNIRMKTTDHPVWIGVNPNISIEAGDYVNAGIKEVKVWRIALTPAQIAKSAAGVYDPSGETDAISEVDADDDERLGLELYYTLEANKIDQASNQVLQGGEQELSFYKSGSVSNSDINYRPDKPHLQLITPTGGEGISNLEDETYTIKWIGFGIGSTAPNSEDIQIEFSRIGTGSGLWEICTDATSSPAGVYLDTVEIEAGQAVWEPYNNVSVSGQYNDLQGVGSTIEQNYVKTVKVKVSGTSGNNQTGIYDTSDPLYVSPYFSLRNGGNAIVYVPGTAKLNVNNSVTFIECWIAPYRFPTAEEAYFPIVSKKGDVEGAGHYALRLLTTGQLQLEITDEEGNVLTANSDATKPIATPNVEEYDTTWYHVGALINLANGTGQSDVRFYIDGEPQTENSITTQLGEAVSVDVTNTYPMYIGYEPGATPEQTVTFVGEMREFRFWNGYPAGMSLSGLETRANPTDVTKFIQGALTVRASDLSTSPTNYQENLVAAFSMNGGSFVNGGVAKTIPSTSSDINAYITGDLGYTGTGAGYEATTPLVKVVEPIYQQQVPNSSTDVRVRWVGFDYDATGFYAGDAADSADLDYSILGGGGLTVKPWTPVASVNYNNSYTNSLSLESTDLYRFSGVSDAVQYAAKLNISIANPDVNGDATYDDQGQIPPALTNARMRLRGRATVNSSTPFEYTDISSLVNPGPLFDLTPPSNFTVRTLLEGFHSGSDEEVADIGDEFDNLGLKISIYDEVAGSPGSKIGSAESTQGYESHSTALDATASPTRGTDGSRFANVPFVFTSLYDGDYYVVVEHLNHLPVMSRFTAPFLFDGDDLTTWGIESGWDFQSWGQNGTAQTSDYMTTASDDEYSGNGLFSAYGEHEVSSNNESYDKTGLIFNQGKEDAETNRMSAMVAGDVYRDGQINAQDRIQVRADNGSNVARSDVTGDGQVNGQDREIVDRNGDKLSSLIDLNVITYQNGQEVETPMFAYMKDGNPFEAISSLDPERSERMNEAAEEFYNSGKVIEPRVYGGNKVVQTQAAGFDYEVKAEPYMNGNIITVRMYLKNKGADFAPGNCTFAFSYETDKLEFLYDEGVKGIAETQDNPFNNNQARGYNLVYSTPELYATNPIPNVRTIDIDYDGYTRPKGVLAPHEWVKLGALKFEVKNLASEYVFEWDKLSVILTVDGKDITDDGILIEIPPVIPDRPVIIEYPNGGEKLTAGRLYTVQWSNPTSEGEAYIEYSTDNGASWNRISDTPVNIGEREYRWVTPRIKSTECLVRLVDAENGKSIDISDNPFTLITIGAEITRPALTDGAYVGGENDMIKWITSDAANVKFEFSPNGQTDWIEVVSAPVNAQNEQVPWALPRVNSKNAKVRMVDVQTSEVLAISQRFVVLAGSLSITNPGDGSSVNIGDRVNVSWDYDNYVDNFDLRFSPDGGQNWQELAADVDPTTGSIAWSVPSVSSDNAIISALYNNDPEMEYSRVQFSIEPVGVAEGGESGFALYEPIPNPFSDETKVQFTLPFEETVTVSVWNGIGKKVATLVDHVPYASGPHTVTFRSEDLPAGVYYIHLNAGSYNKTRRVVKIK